jgi:hypothetical protein
MPSRPIRLLIVAFWMGTMFWMFWRDWLPWMTAEDQSPPFSFDLADEVVTQHASWQLWRNDQKVGTARSRIRYLKDNTFEWTTTLQQLEFRERIPLTKFEVQVVLNNWNNVLVVTPKGELVRLKSSGEISISALGVTIKPSIQLSGEVQGDGLVGQISLESREFGDELGNIQESFGPIPLKNRYVFNSMQPLFSIHDLRPGRRWKMNQFDPVMESLKAGINQLIKKSKNIPPNLKLPDTEPTSILAEVLSDTQKLIVEGKEYRCFVIEYKSNELTGRTWVRVSDGMVLRQEATGIGEKLILQREIPLN